MRRSTPLRRTGGPKRKTPLRQRKPWDAPRSPLNRTTLTRKRASGGRARPDEPLADRCQVALPDLCRGRATDRHHILPRSAGGGDEAANTLDCCNPCHIDGIHGNPARAYQRGWLRKRSAA